MSAETMTLTEAYDLLGVRADDRVGEARYITVGALEESAVDGKPAVWTEKGFASLEQMKTALGSQAADPDDPNPLPSFVLEHEQGEFTLYRIEYNPVYGMDLGECLVLDAEVSTEDARSFIFDYVH